MNEIRAVAPTRVDFAGGTLDLWPIQRVLGVESATVNVGVTLNAETRVSLTGSAEFEFESADQAQKISGSWDDVVSYQPTRLIGSFARALWNPQWGGLRICTTAQSPAGAGLGGSSALAVTLVGALTRLASILGYKAAYSEDEMVNICSNTEAGIIQIPTGVQDYWGAMRGCVNVLTYPPEGVHVATFPTSEMTFLSERLVLCYSGKSRASARNNWDIFKAVFDKDKAVIHSLSDIAKSAQSCAEAAKNLDWESFVEASRREWMCREQLWPDIHSVETKSLAVAAEKAGATFSRVCGAGGGGVMAILVEPQHRDAVKAALGNAGGQVLEANISACGLHVTEGIDV